MSVSYGAFPKVRSRRLRGNPNVRHLVRETVLSPTKLIMPIFIKQGLSCKQPIPTMPGLYQWSLEDLEQEIEAIVKLGMQSVLLFGVPAEKDAIGTAAYSDVGIIQNATALIKKHAPTLTVIADLCFCEYTDHGHCGVVEAVAHRDHLDVHNDKTLLLLAKQAVSLAQAGVDIIAPSGCIDGMVGAIREALDEAGFHHLPILSYAVKYASHLYGPFRAAAEGAPQFGDRSTYQMDYANANEALRECALDVLEGADMLMVKPAHTYLDVIYRIKQAYPALPLTAYHVSGEYGMIKAAAAQGWLDEKKAVMEILTAIHRAGADFIITYYAKAVAAWLTASS
jgi:porphobilinogen synthase